MVVKEWAVWEEGSIRMGRRRRESGIERETEREVETEELAEGEEVDMIMYIACWNSSSITL